MPISPLKMKDSNNLHHLVNTNASVTSVETILFSKPCLVNMSKNGWTPLMIASSEGYDDLVTVLLQHGARLEDADGKGATALTLAVDNNHLSTVTLHCCWSGVQTLTMSRVVAGLLS